MDTDSLKQVTEAVQTLSGFDWTPVIWLVGSIGGLIITLLTVIAYLIRSDKDNSKDAIRQFSEAWNRHDEIIRQQQKEIHDLALESNTAIALIKQEQKQGQERLRIFQENFFERKRGKR